MSNSSKVALIGFGKLGSIIARRLVETQVCHPRELWVCRQDSRRLKEIEAQIPRCQARACLVEAVTDAEVVIVAVRPGDLAQVGRDLAPVLNPTQTVLSVVTGKTFLTLTRVLGTRRLVRASTSILAATGQARSVYMIEPSMATEVSGMAIQIIRSWGEALETVVENDVKTAIVAIGALPGLVAYGLGAFVAAIEAQGWSREEALREVLLSTLGLCHRAFDQKLDLADIVRSVATKGGITQAGLDVFAQLKLSEVIEAGIAAAITRTEELDG
ncbi:MAG: hypothetical protein A3H14_03095 [Candidatus Doudnabacteria bacterium RIFCSPLOWO2_12_FULL_49_8]|nr:MAG: hypothetical protein A3H14_03095 [Candidatus Doudnabacteria bacterium RIFCSPLOWO2_12_FULL_49_8]